ncbi:MAG TPA: hypothetical protein VN577_16105 [Terriglobales bacterium]|nr:hypothetical protein [Terriglobales bacterium]
MEPTIQDLQVQIEELRNKLNESEQGRQFLVEHFTERLSEDSEKRAQELLAERLQSKQESVQAQLKSIGLKRPDSYAEYKSLSLTDQARCLSEFGGEAFMADLLRKKAAEDAELRRKAIIEQQAKKNPTL